MKDKKIVFMGTPIFAKNVLEKLIEEVNVIAVVTQPDKEVGRKKILTKSPVKIFAEEHNIKVLQPIKLRKEYEDIINLKPDMIITCAYGQILPKELLEYPKYKTINVHGSLLPKYRGGAPIQWAIINGEEKTGITIMQTFPGMDDGDMIKKQEIKIEENDNYDTLNEKLSYLGRDLLIETLPSIFNKTCTYEKQNDNEATFAYTIKKEDEHINFHDTAKNIHNKIRGLAMTPGANALLEDKIIKIYETKIGNDINNEPGTIINIYKDGIGVATSDKELIITKLQIPGKKIMNVKDYLNGVDKNNLLNKHLS